MAMTVLDISDEQIARLTRAQRQELIRRLSRHTFAGLPSLHAVQRIRRRRLFVMIGGVVVLVPWTVYLGMTLPDRHVAHNWSVTWVGFDILLLLTFATTALFGLLRRQLVVLGAFASSILLLCDAWFDVTTASAGREFWWALATAVVFEIPIAALLASSALRLLRLMAVRLWLIEPGDRLWMAPIPLAELIEPRRDSAAKHPVSP